MATSPRRKLVSKRLLPNVEGRNTPSKSVTFNEDIVETSFGGTTSVSRMKKGTLFPVENVSRSKKERKSGSRTSDVPEKQTGKENKRQTDDSEKGAKGDGIDLKKVDSFSSRRPNASLETNLPSESPFKTPPVKGRRHTLETKLFETPDCYKTVDLETPNKYDDNDYSSSTEDGEDSCSVTVAVRVRPFSQRELADPNVKCVVSMNGNETTVTSESGVVHRFAYDFSFWSFNQSSEEDDMFSAQENVYNQLAQPLLGKAFDGYNTCLFAYGQTGSGKSYSIMGHGEEVGIIPRFCEELFGRVDLVKNKEQVKINVEISFFEIYNEKIHDLLASVKEKSAKKLTLKVREHPALGPYVEGLSTYVVNSFEDVEGWITLGNKNRATASTGMNDKSSRSHSVFTIMLTQSKTERLEGTDHEHCTNSKINLVDLAGSERQSQAQTTGERLREGANINKSLMALGKVISLLSEQSLTNKKRKLFIPYRDSVLTWLLKESLGGNSKTAMIATISPANHHVEETLSTLRYAKQARSIVNVVRVNEDPKAKLIRELRAEIEKLKKETGSSNEFGNADSIEEILALRDKLAARERELNDITRSWQEKLQRSEERKAEEARQLEKSGVAFKVDNQLPNLVNLNEDPQLAELLLYVIKEGQTRVGRMSPTSHHDIQLNGALIADNHCIINNEDSVVSITPIGDAPTYLNGNMITEPSILHHGDRLVLGGDHYFRFNHPKEVKLNTKKGKGAMSVKDFEFARQELIDAQEARLQNELEEARKEAEAEMQQELEKAKQESQRLLQKQQTSFEDKLADLEKALEEQSRESKKAQQSRQDTEDLVNKLKQQKKELEQEMLENKKKQQLDVEAQHKGMKSYKNSPLIQLLEAEKKKAEDRLAELKIKRAEIKSPFIKTPDRLSGRKDLYKVALLLREANKISQYLKKKIIFSREDVMEDNVVKPLIKVTNGNHNMCTFWSVRKLENKIIQMRDLYQNGGDCSTDDEEVFNDPEDSWEKDSILSSPVNSPHVSGYQMSPLPSSGKRRTSLQANTSSSSLRRVSGSWSNNKTIIENDASVFKVCKDLIATLTESLTDVHFEESIGDKILMNCQVLKQTVSAVMDHTKSSVDGGKDDLTIRRYCIQLVSTLQLLTSNCTLWSNLVEGKEKELLHDLLKSMSNHTKVMSNQAAMLLQGHENDIGSLVQESGSKTLDGIYSVCKLCGEVALASHTKMIRLQQLTADISYNQLGHDICQLFISGSDVYVDRTLTHAIKTLEDCEMKAKIYSDEAAPDLNVGDLAENIELAISATKILLQKCQEIQVEVDTSMRESSDSRPMQFYNLHYRRSASLVTQVHNITDSASLLLQSAAPILKGVGKEWKKFIVCSEMIQTCAMKLLSSSGKESGSKRDSSDSNDSDISVLSDTQMEQLEYAAQEVKSATTTLLNQTQKHCKNVSTPSRTTPFKFGATTPSQSSPFTFSKSVRASPRH